MNEEEIKNLWQAERRAPEIDFTRIEKLSEDWHRRLRRKVKTDIGAQVSAAVGGLLLFAFYPGLLFFSVTVIILCVWYVRELRGLYRTENGESDHLPVRELLEIKVRTFKDYFRRTRLAMYVVTPLMIASALYGLNFFSFSSLVSGEKIVFLTVCLAGYEAVAFVSTELYFKFLYAPALTELENLLKQIETGE